MSLQIGDVNVVSQLLENEFRVSVLEQVVNHLVAKFPSVGEPPITPDDLARIREQVVADMQRKYPESGITLRSGQA
jgi:hypothetical protein